MRNLTPSCRISHGLTKNCSFSDKFYKLLNIQLDIFLDTRHTMENSFHRKVFNYSFIHRFE